MNNDPDFNPGPMSSNAGMFDTVFASVPWPPTQADLIALAERTDKMRDGLEQLERFFQRARASVDGRLCATCGLEVRPGTLLFYSRTLDALKCPACGGPFRLPTKPATP